MTETEIHTIETPCPECGTFKRYTKHGGCVKCHRDRANKQRQECREKHHIEDWHKRMAGVNYQTEKTIKLGIL